MRDAQIKSSRLTPILAAILLTAQVCLLLWPAWHDSPTYDEPAHLLAGLSYWKTGKFGIYRVNPPLPRLIGSIPVALLSPSLPPILRTPAPGERSEFSLAAQMVQENGPSSLLHISLARTMLIPMVVLGGFVVFWWARDLYGNEAGLLALLLWCTSPNILAHGHLMTPDVTSTSFAILASFRFSRWLKQPNLANVCWTAVSLAAALLSKSTWLVLFPIFVMASAIHFNVINEHLRAMTKARIVQLAAIFGLAIWFVNLGYGFEGVLQPLGEFSFSSRSLSGETNGGLGNRFRNTWLSGVPVPFPYNFVQGIDEQKAGMDNNEESYLQGQWKRGGWWYYYLYGLGTKVPLGFWCLMLLAGISAFLVRTSWRLSTEIMLVVPPLVVLCLVSSQIGMNKHFRYILPVLPYFFVWSSKVATFSQAKIRRLSGFACVWFVSSSLWIWPHCLSYFNESVGGPMRGDRCLADSNIDWGQDLLYFARLMESPVIRSKTPTLAYFGFSRPDELGLHVDLVECPNDKPVHWPRGYYAISTNLARGMCISFPTTNGVFTPQDHDTFKRFRHEQPIAMAGYSIRLYQIDD